MKENYCMEFDREYFEAEVRDGFYVTAEMKQAWAAQLEVLNDFDKACRENGLEYYADWGTMLGAVRHGGFIPWDDDIDVCMKRPDYNRFLQIAKDIMPDGYEIYNIYTDEDNDNLLSRVINARSISFDEYRLRKFHGFPYVAGIDIAPLDYIAPKKEEVDFQKNLILIINSILRLIRNYEQTENDNTSLEEIKDYVGQIEKLCAISIDWNKNLGQQMNMLLAKLCGLYKEEECDYICSMTEWIKAGRQKYPKEYYNNIIRIPFENITVPVPREYDVILTELYGDYHEKVHNCDSHDYPFFVEQRDKAKEWGAPIVRFKADMKSYRDFMEQERIIRKLRNSVKENSKKKKVVFMPFKEKNWSTMQPLWEKYSQDKDIDAIVMPVLYYYKNIDGTVDSYEEKDKYPSDLNLVSIQEYDFQKERPDEIIFQNPYDEYNIATTVHPMFYSKNLYMHTDKLTYIPYFTTEEIAEDDMRADVSMNEYVTMPGVVYSDRVILQSENIKKLYVRKLVEFYGEDTRDEWENKLCTTF